MGRILFWTTFPIRVIFGVIRDEIEFYKIVHHHVTSKPGKDIEV